MGQLWFSPRPPRDLSRGSGDRGAQPLLTLYREFRERGVIIQPPQEGLLLRLGRHTTPDIERTIEIAREVMPAVARAAAEGRVGPHGGVR